LNGCRIETLPMNDRMSDQPLLGVLAAMMLSLGGLLAQEFRPIPLAEVDHSIEWTEVSGEPSWWHKPVAATDCFSFRTSEVGEVDAWAKKNAVADAERDVRNVLFDHLQPVFGDATALRVIEEMLQQTVLVDAVLGSFKFGSDDHAVVFGAACLCWRTPIRSVVEKFDPSIQGRIERVLLREMVHWKLVDRPPGWLQGLPVRDGFFRCAFTCPGKKLSLTKLAGVSGARANVHAHLVELLTPVVGKALAAKAADAAIERLAPVAKILVDRRENSKRVPRFTAYCMWEVPTGPAVRVLPKGLRAAALAALQQ
jgi:hypothetical protein